jgi:hypothetical protein
MQQELVALMKSVRPLRSDLSTMGDPDVMSEHVAGVVT